MNTTIVALSEREIRALLDLISDVQYGSPTLAGAKRDLKAGLAAQAAIVTLHNPVTGPRTLRLRAGGAQ